MSPEPWLTIIFEMLAKTQCRHILATRYEVQIFKDRQYKPIFIVTMTTIKSKFEIISAPKHVRINVLNFGNISSLAQFFYIHLVG